MPYANHGAIPPRDGEQMARRAADHRVAVLAPARHGQRIFGSRLAVDQKASIARKVSAPMLRKMLRILQQVFSPRTGRIEHQPGANVELNFPDAVTRTDAAHTLALP